MFEWNDFQENVTTAFGSLKGDNMFTDVTLACEDGQQIEAHKVILASCSPFFENLLNKNAKKHKTLTQKTSTDHSTAAKCLITVKTKSGEDGDTQTN